MNNIRVNELFYSIQAEGQQVGMPAWFIRFSGCNLTCEWCDSKYAKDGKEINIESIANSVPANICNNVIITGGEPLLQEDLLPLLKRLGHMNIYIETNGTIYDSNLIGFAKFIVSPKPQFLNKEYMKSLRKWSGRATFKFVMGNKDEFDTAVNLCKKLNLKDWIEVDKPIYFMPEGTTDKKIKETMISMAEWVKEEASYVRISPRLQIYLYGNKRGV